MMKEEVSPLCNMGKTRGIWRQS